jgi:hypothetical protein
MTHGRTAKNPVNKRSKKGGPPLTRFSESPRESLESRVAKLEARIEQMQEQIDRASGATPAWFQHAIDAVDEKRPGPQKRIDDTELLLNRDKLIQWLEEHWLKIVQPLLAASASDSPSDLAAALEPISARREVRPEWQKRFFDHLSILVDFLKSRKFRRKPPKKTVVDAVRLDHSEQRQRAANRLPTRQIANAMAGVPKLGWRTSLDKCSKCPSSARVGYSAATYYRRMFGIPEGEV